MFNQQFQFMVILAPDGTVLEANDTCFRTTGVPRESVMGGRSGRRPGGTDCRPCRSGGRSTIAEAVRTDGPVTGEVDYTLADGSVRHATIAVTVLKDEAGRVDVADDRGAR